MNDCNVITNVLYLGAPAFPVLQDYLGWFGVSSGRMRVILQVVGAQNSPAPGERLLRKGFHDNLVTV